nr:hypothetical protein Iba_chr08dCG14540 [Ipomoea batatas]GME08150.1 hypothetical protein Iba_scaffold7290CG0020 [Ipomoea batatas]
MTRVMSHQEQPAELPLHGQQAHPQLLQEAKRLQQELLSRKTICHPIQQRRLKQMC